MRSSGEPPILSFRPIAEDDREYRYRLDEATMRTYAEQTYGSWNEEIVRRILAERWRPETMQVVQVDGQDAGLLEVIETDESVQLANIRVAPEYQRRGIGTQLVSEIVRDAHARGLTVMLRVLKVNPARRLYERLGFVVVGETEPHYLMEARPLA